MRLSNSLYCRLTALAVLALVVLAQVLAPAGSGAAPSALLIPSFFYPAGWSVMIFLVIVLSIQDRAILAGSITAWALLGAVGALAMGGSIDDVRRLYLISFGMAPYLFVFARIIVRSGAERSRWIDILAVSSLIHMSALGNNFFRDQTAEWLPKILDLKLAELDESFGVQFSAVMAHVLPASPFLYRLSWLAYNFVHIPIVIVAAFHWRRKDPESFSILPTFILGSMIGYACYWVTPAIGPRAYFGGDFPLLHATSAYLAQQPFDFDPRFDRNAMPSMHISWALLIFLYARGFSMWARAYAGLFVILTACATLGFGEHYFIDLVVAAPLVLLIRALFSIELSLRTPERWQAFGVGLGLLAFWLGTIRFAPLTPPWAALIFIGATLTLSARLERGLTRAEGRACDARRGAQTRWLSQLSLSTPSLQTDAPNA